MLRIWFRLYCEFFHQRLTDNRWILSCIIMYSLNRITQRTLTWMSVFFVLQISLHRALVKMERHLHTILVRASVFLLICCFLMNRIRIFSSSSFLINLLYIYTEIDYFIWFLSFLSLIILSNLCEAYWDNRMEWAI